MAADGVGSFALVLHTHLPFVLGHGRWPHGSDWLMEVAAGCYGDRLQQFERLNGDLVGALRALADQGHVTLITCAATHGYLPLLSREESIDLQLRVAVATHRHHFGRAPDGIWLPECAYRPRYEWTPPVGPHKGGRRVRRRGIGACVEE